jgi:predicted component of type VI protein secretion system
MIKIGTVLHGEEVDLGGGWVKPPKVIVTQTTLKTYDSAYAGDQTVSVGVGSLYRTPFIEEYRFVADVSLRESSHVQNTVINDGIGPTALETWTSPVYTTPADAEEVTIAVGVKTQKGNGLNWNMRTIQVVIEYYDTDASSWEALSGVNDLVFEF